MPSASARVYFIAVAQRLDELWPRSSAHVRAWASVQLDPETEGEVLAALARGDDEAAVKLYFSQAGRWEPVLLRALAEDGTAAGDGPDEALMAGIRQTGWRSTTRKPVTPRGSSGRRSP